MPADEAPADENIVLDREVVARLQRLYSAFNDRQIDAVLAVLTEDVDWPNGWQGGRLNGRPAVRAYWERQWVAINPRVEPQRIFRAADGRYVVDVHQVVSDLDGVPLSDGIVQHVYRERGRQFDRMEIHDSPETHLTPS